MTSTKSIGEILREERLKHRLSLSDLAKRTRIRLSYLEALEDSQFNQLPAAIFVKGYIRAYGQVFGFDHKPLLGLLRRDYKESAKGTLVPREFLKPVLKKQPLFQRVTGMVIALMVIFAVLLTYVAVQWYRFSQPPIIHLATPEADAFVSAQVEVKGTTEPDAILSVNSQPIALQPDGSFSTIVFLPREGVNTISIEATDRQNKKSLVQRTVRVKF